jgi:DNA-directed RNA polymerase subunit M/transcription elongation factor TFIIS
MKSVAILDPDTAAHLVEHLQEAQIRCETRVVTEESGVESAEVLVDDEQYDQACEASEKWQEALVHEAQKRVSQTCPKCRTPQAMERVQDTHYEEMGLVVFRCKQCGEAFPL